MLKNKAKLYFQCAITIIIFPNDKAKRLPPNKISVDILN